MKLLGVVARAIGWWSPRSASASASGPREKAAALAAAGREHLVAARVARDLRLPASGALLYGRAISAFSDARALLSAPAEQAPPAAQADGGGGPGMAVGDPAAELASSPLASTAQGADALTILREPGKAESLDARRVRKALSVLEGMARGLQSGLFPLSDGEVRAARLRRRVGAALLLCCAAVLLIRWTVSPKNVARGKPVTVSSIRLGTPQGIVNGAIEWGTFGLHSGSSGREWATIDLQKFFSLSSAEIYSRGDGRFEFNLPLMVELSDDGARFRPGGSCPDLFTQATPCVVNLHRERARFVRVSAPEVVLAEVEVYGVP